MGKKIGNQSMEFANPPYLLATAASVGALEGQGPLGQYFDIVNQDSYLGQESWEKAETTLISQSIQTVLQKSGLTSDQVDYVFCGDLLNQMIATHFAMRDFPVPFFGLYGACSTMAESLILGSVTLDGGFGNKCIAAVSSHHDSAERQYRFPTELGVQRPPAAQWTVTGSGAALLAVQGQGPRVTTATVGKIVDLGVKDVNNMGAAMAPAAADTLMQHFKDTGRTPAYYDLIVTGDLGAIGKQLTLELLANNGVNIQNNYEDCGVMIYDPSQDMHAGGSGCGCSATVMCGYLYYRMRQQELTKLLFVGTGALHSPVSYQQKESIPSIAHAVSIEL